MVQFVHASARQGSSEADPDVQGRGDAEDARLVAAALAGSSDAFSRLFRTHERAARQRAASIIRDRATQDDIVQIAFTRAFDRLATLRDASMFRSWLLQAVRNAALDHVRDRARRPENVELSELLGSCDPSPEEVAELRELAGRLELAALRLPRRDAVALALTVQFGLSPTELADALGVTPNNAKVILHRARQRLRAAAKLE